MATMPERIRGAIVTVNSIYKQADKIRIYLNNFKEIPKEFLNDDKIEVVIGGQDLKSTGKLFWALNKNEYYFCIDDDLIYPRHYAKDMLAKLNQYNDNIIVSLHGKILMSTPLKSYFRDLEISEHCLKETLNDRNVHVIGNGVSLFNTNNLKIDYKQFEYHYMDDIMVSIECQKQNIPALVMKHKSNYLVYNDPKVKTLFDEFANNDETQTETVNKIQWKII